MKLYKTTITILSEYNPHMGVEPDDLVRDAMSGDAYLYGETTEEIDSNDLDGEGVKEFFGCLEPDDIPEVYQSEFGWGYVGCESDCYATEIEARNAAIDSIN